MKRQYDSTVVSHDIHDAILGGRRGAFVVRITEGLDDNAHHYSDQGLTKSQLRELVRKRDFRNWTVEVNHDYTGWPAGAFTDAWFDERDGWLYGRAEFDLSRNENIALYNKVKERIARGERVPFSVGFNYLEMDTIKGRRCVNKSIHEGSFVENPKEPGARVLAVHNHTNKYTGIPRHMSQQLSQASSDATAARATTELAALAAALSKQLGGGGGADTGGTGVSTTVPQTPANPTDAFIESKTRDWTDANKRTAFARLCKHARATLAAENGSMTRGALKDIAAFLKIDEKLLNEEEVNAIWTHAQNAWKQEQSEATRNNAVAQGQAEQLIAQLQQQLQAEAQKVAQLQAEKEAKDKQERDMYAAQNRPVLEEYVKYLDDNPLDGFDHKNNEDCKQLLRETFENPMYQPFAAMISSLFKTQQQSAQVLAEQTERMIKLEESLGYTVGRLNGAAGMTNANNKRRADDVPAGAAPAANVPATGSTQASTSSSNAPKPFYELLDGLYKTRTRALAGGFSSSANAPGVMRTGNNSAPTAPAAAMPTMPATRIGAHAESGETRGNLRDEQEYAAKIAAQLTCEFPDLGVFSELANARRRGVFSRQAQAQQ